MTLHLGKQPATVDSRDLQFHAYVDTDLIDLNSQPPGMAYGHADRMPQPRIMLGNGPDPSVAPGFEGAGDCVFACITNYLRLAWSISDKGLFPANGRTAIDNYSEVTGYVLNDPSTDNGTNMRQAMNWWRNTGYKDANGQRHKIGAWCAVNFRDWNHVLWAQYLADEGVPLGINFPASAMTQFNANEPWEPVKGSPSEGGHAILLDKDLRFTKDAFDVESWARAQRANKPFLVDQVDEAYFVVDEDGLVNGKSLEGFDSQQLLSDAQALTSP